MDPAPRPVVPRPLPPQQPLEVWEDLEPDSEGTGSCLLRAPGQVLPPVTQEAGPDYPISSR